MDAASFYLLLTLMSFAAYGLVVHSGTVEALRAGRGYLAMAVLGEGVRRRQRKTGHATASARHIPDSMS